MRTKRIELWAAVVVLLAVYSCTELQEPQIDEKHVEIFVPRDSLHTDMATQMFYWYHVEGASTYELQIVTPSFERIDQLVLDTNISGNKFEFTLAPGTYEWSVRGYNFSSSTDYTVHTLFIDSTLDLSGQKVILTEPADHDTANRESWVFNWQPLYNAETYHFELWQPGLNGQLITSRETQKDSLHLELSDEGNYWWRVRAENAQGQTAYASREIFIDTTRPAPPLPDSPPQGQFFNSLPIDFSWDRNPDPGSSLRDTLYLALDSNITNIERRISSKNREARINTLPPGIYYWAVRSFDKAGNKGELSLIRQFTLQ